MVQKEIIMEGEVLIICGCTAVGKSDFALCLARELNVEIVSADSMQIYKSLDVGTSKPTTLEKKICKHHMVDIVSPFDTFNTFEYTKLAHRVITEIWERGYLPVIVGGTGLYIESLVNNYSFKNSQSKEINSYKARTICLTRDREKVYNRINERVDEMLSNGLVDEIKTLRAIGVTEGYQCMRGIGYHEICDYLEDRISLADAVDNIKRNTRNYAKRQLTWFRHMNCEWVDVDTEKEPKLLELVEYYKIYKKEKA